MRFHIPHVLLFFAKSLFLATRPSSRPSPNRLFSCARAVLLAVALSLLNQSIVPVWWTVLVSSKTEKRRWGHRTRAPLQAFSGPRKGKQQLTLLTLLDSSICFFTKSCITGKTTGPRCRANQNRDISPTVTGSKCWVLTLFVSQLSRRFDTKHLNHGCLKGQKNAGVVVGNIGKIDSPCQPPCSRGLGGKTYVSECWANYEQ